MTALPALQPVFVNVVLLRVADVQLPPLPVQTDAGGMCWLMVDLVFNLLTIIGQTFTLFYLHSSDQTATNVEDLQLVTGAVDHDHVSEVINDQGSQITELHSSFLVSVRDHGGLVSTDDVNIVEARI